MTIKPALKTVGVFFLVWTSVAAFIAFAMLAGGALEKAAKTSSREAGLKQQSVQPGTQSIDDQLRRASQQKEAAQAASSITYFFDPRTNLCFAIASLHNGYGNENNVVVVGCGCIPQDILITVKK